MVLVRSLLVVFLNLSLTISPAQAFDPLGTEILTLRLGMTEAKVVDRLTYQGWQIARTGQCAARNCPDPIRAPTKDGVLLVDFGTGGVVRRVTYTLAARSPEEAALVRAAVVAHFGQPSIEAPLSWCQSPALDRHCSPNQPRLTFQIGESFGGVLMLTAGDT
jgi:hypothetical protein